DQIDVGRQRLCGGLQRLVLGDRRQQRQDAGSDPGAACGVMDLSAQVGKRWCLQTHLTSVSVLSRPSLGCPTGTPGADGSRYPLTSPGLPHLALTFFEDVAKVL